MVSIVTCHGLKGPVLESQWGKRFSFFNIYQTGCETHPVSCTMGAGVLHEGWSGHVIALTTQLHLVVRFSISVAIPILLPLCQSWHVTGGLVHYPLTSTQETEAADSSRPLVTAHVIRIQNVTIKKFLCFSLEVCDKSNIAWTEWYIFFPCFLVVEFHALVLRRNLPYFLRIY
jgi:hypothetical protein